jgi:hypothetical protein
MTAERFTYVLRLTRHGDGRLLGQWQEPMSGWQSAYLELDELWRALNGRVASDAGRPGGEEGQATSGGLAPTG